MYCKVLLLPVLVVLELLEVHSRQFRINGQKRIWKGLRAVCKMMGINLDSKTVPDHKVPALARVPNCTAVPDHKVPRYTREFRRTAIAACAENTTAMQPCSQRAIRHQSKKTAATAMAITATATHSTQQLSLLRIWARNFFAQANLPGAGDLRHRCAHVPWPCLPLLLRLSCLSVRCRWDVDRRSSVWLGSCCCQMAQGWQVAAAGEAEPLSAVSRCWLPLFGLGLVLVLGLVQERCYYLPAQTNSTRPALLRASTVHWTFFSA